MAIIQISKVLVRTGDEQDLPQLDTGEFGYSTDVKKLYIGDDPNNNPENLVINNTEVLTEHSAIAFSQIDVATVPTAQGNGSTRITANATGTAHHANDGATAVNAPHSTTMPLTQAVGHQLRSASSPRVA